MAHCEKKETYDEYLKRRILPTDDYTGIKNAFDKMMSEAVKKEKTQALPKDPDRSSTVATCNIHP